MAIQMDFTSPSLGTEKKPVVFKDAYYVITNAAMNFANQTAHGAIQVYASKEAYKEGKESLSAAGRGPGGRRPGQEPQQEDPLAGALRMVVSAKQDPDLYAKLAGASDLRAEFYTKLMAVDVFAQATAV